MWILAFLLAIAPWGKDAELAYKKRAVPVEAEQNLMQKVAKGLIRFHQEVISPADGPRSHFYPSSSSYTLQAIEKHGFFKGFLLGCDRLMRENDDPWLYAECKGPEGYPLKLDKVP